MRPVLALVFVLAFLFAGVLPVSPACSAATCGRARYPDENAFSDEFVVDRDLWNEFLASGGFSNATEAQRSLSLSVVGPTRNYTVTLNETTVTDYVGGLATNRTAIDLRVRVEEQDGRVEDLTFRAVSLGGRAGGNLTLAARADETTLTIFWRWAYLPCDETFPNSYYVFHSTLDEGGIRDNNDLVYFEAPRPRRSPPVDLILLVVAGIAVSVIFLLARQALRRKP